MLSAPILPLAPDDRTLRERTAHGSAALSKPHPQQWVTRMEPKAVPALPAQDDYLMSEGDKLELQ
jgi:hypothetical protein